MNFKLWVALMLGTFMIMVLTGLGVKLQKEWAASPVDSMKGISASVSSQFFIDLLKMEMPLNLGVDGESTFSERHIAQFLFQFVTGINPADPKTILAMEVPGLSHETVVPLQVDGGEMTPPREYTPPVSVNPSDSKAEEEPLPTVPIIPDGPEFVPATFDSGAVGGKEEESVPSALTRNKKVFIYHSHNRESWLPELEGKTELREAYDDDINITLLGKRMATRLQDLGVGALYSKSDYKSEVKNYSWNFSYKYSMQTVQEAFAAHPTLEYYFDIHRDANPREKTTVTIDGQTYAQIYFIIGHANPDWEKNEAFAAQIHDKLEQSYPGLSKGIWGKTSKNGHGEYNQSFSPHSILVEVGGPENTLEESYRTIEVFAETVAEIVMNARKVDTTVSER